MIKKLIFAAVIIFNCRCDEKPLLVISCSKNNIDWYQKHLNSILDQKYDNYRLIYIDDASTDGTQKAVKNFLKNHPKKNKVKVIFNKIAQGSLENQFMASSCAKENEILLFIDGDDWTFGNHVFKTINSHYDDSNVWCTYGQFIYSKGGCGECRKVPNDVIKSNSYRNHGGWPTSHLKTVYSSVYKKIKLKDLLHQDKFFSCTGDVAQFLPIIEMAGTHTKFIRDILYVYNIHTNFNDFKLRHPEQLSYEEIIRSRPKYAPLKSLNFDSIKKELSIGYINLERGRFRCRVEFRERTFNTLEDALQKLCKTSLDYICVGKVGDVKNAVNALERTEALAFYFLKDCSDKKFQNLSLDYSFDFKLFRADVDSAVENLIGFNCIYNRQKLEEYFKGDLKDYLGCFKVEGEESFFEILSEE